MSNLDLRSISSFEIDPKNYCASLLSIALEKALLAPEDFETFQYSVMEFTNNYIMNRKEHGFSVITDEDLQDYLQAILYILDLRVKKESTPADALSLLINVPIEQLFSEGIKKANAMLLHAKTNFKKISESAYPFEGSNYIDTITSEIPSVFRTKLVAEKINLNVGGEIKAVKEVDIRDLYACAEYGTFSYRTVIENANCTGIEYLDKYISALCFENDFLCNFDMSAIATLVSEAVSPAEEIVMLEFDDDDKAALHSDIESFELDFFEENYYSLVMITMLKLLTLGKDPMSLFLSKEDRSNLQHYFLNGKSKEQISEMYSSVLRSFLEYTEFNSHAKQYFLETVPFIL